MVKITFPHLLLLLVLHQVALCEVVQVILLTRHGDRTPFGLLQKDPVNWKNLTGVDIGGELTGLGMRQCYELGKHLKQRYLEQSSEFYISGITESYSAQDFHFRSSAENRCLQSSWALSMGMFPGNGLIDDITQKAALPNQTQAIDIHSDAPKNDLILRASDFCPAIERVFELKKNQDEYKALEKKYAGFMTHMHRVTGETNSKSLESFYWFADLVLAQHYHGVLHIPALVTDINLIAKLGSISLLERRGKRDVIGKHVGGPFVSHVLELMRRQVNKQPDRKKFYHFSGHDSTIVSVLTALRLTDDYPELFEKPPYGSTIAFELHKTPNEQLHVRILYKRGTQNEFDNLTLKTLGKRGCNETCPYEEFVTLALDDATIGDWCSACANNEADICLRNRLYSEDKQAQLLLIAVITVGVMFGATIILLVAVLVLRGISSSGPRLHYETVG